ncbi:MAG: hypothetical protein F4X01_03650 [Nitrospira sp. SB0661_bin_20]|nr:hypothetical protein [Nitrospira sp. SB0661_bin_20]
MCILLLGLITSCLSGPLNDGYPPSPAFLQPTENKRFVEIVTIQNLLQAPGQYHQKRIRVRGTVTRLELHLDDSKHFINFVFSLKTKTDRVLVFGRHDRTQGDIQMTTGRTVEVEGIFWKEREANGHKLLNNVEARRVRFYPSLTPDQAGGRSALLPS